MAKKDTQGKRDYQKYIHQQIKDGKYNAADGSWKRLPADMDPRSTHFMQT